jgi:hypothetical protein
MNGSAFRFYKYYSNLQTIMFITKKVTDEIVDVKIKQLRSIHPELAAIAQRIHEMNLKEVVNIIDGFLWSRC